MKSSGMKRGRNSTSNWIFVMPLAVLGLFAWMIAQNVSFVRDFLRPATFDGYQKAALAIAAARSPKNEVPASGHSRGRTADVVYVDIDPDMTAAHPAWPWPRDLLANLTRKLYDAGASIVVFDTVFEKPDQQSPEVLLDALWQNDQTKSLVGPVSMLPDHDAILAGAFKDGKVVTSFYGRNRTGGTAASSSAVDLATPGVAAAPTSKAAIAVINGAALHNIRKFSAARDTIPVLTAAAAGNGANTVLFDSDYVVRQLPLVIQIGDTVYPTQLTEALRLHENADQIFLNVRGTGNRTHLVAARIGKRTIPVTDEGGVLLDLSDTPLAPKIDAEAILSAPSLRPRPERLSLTETVSDALLSDNPLTDQPPADSAAADEANSGGSNEPMGDADADGDQGANTGISPQDAPALTGDNAGPSETQTTQSAIETAALSRNDAEPSLNSASPDTAEATGGDRTPNQSSASTALRPDQPSILSQLDGKIVVVGLEGEEGAQQARFRIATPIGTEVSAPRLKATALNQILAGTFLSRPAWAKWLEVALVVAAGLFLCGVATFAQPYTAFGLLGAVVILMMGSGWYMFRHNGFLFDMTTPAVAAALSFTLCLLIGAGRRRSDIIVTTPVSRTMPAAVSLDSQASAPKLKRGTSKNPNRAGTILVCSIRGLSELEESFTHDPAGFKNLVSDFLSKLTHQVNIRNGSILQFVNDEFIAAWNVASEDPDHQIHACECALRSLDALDNLNETLDDHAHSNNITIDPVRLNIGINTGKVRAGLAGSRAKSQHSIVGEGIETARWLNAHAPHYGPAIIVGEETYAAANPGFAFLEVDLIRIKDRVDPYRVFALMGNPVTKAKPQFRELEQAHEAIFAAYRTRQWSKALELIKQTREKSGTAENLYDLYENRIDHYTKNPPPDDWQGEYIESLK